MVLQTCLSSLAAADLEAVEEIGVVVGICPFLLSDWRAIPVPMVVESLLFAPLLVQAPLHRKHLPQSIHPGHRVVPPRLHSENNQHSSKRG